MAEEQNYTLGRGRIFFAPFLTGTQTPGGERWLGNAPELNLTIERETLEHFSSYQGIREKDLSIPLQVNRTGTLITDNIDPNNVALFFFGTTLDVARTGATVTDEAHNDVKKGYYYQLGVSANNPAGVKGLDLHTTPSTKIVVNDTTIPTPVTYVEGTDYTVDMDLGRVYIVPTGAIANDTDLRISYKTKTSTTKRIISGSSPVEGSLRYVAANPAGANIDYFMPYVSLAPNGDYALIGDELQQIPFTLEILKKTGLEAIYAEGRPVFA